MATITHDDLALCVDCTMALVNGVETDDQERAAEDMARIWGDSVRHMVVSDYDEPFFSWSRCDGCGSTLGGDRYPAVVFAA